MAEFRYYYKTPDGVLFKINPVFWEWFNASPERLPDGATLIWCEDQEAIPQIKFAPFPHFDPLDWMKEFLA